MLYHAMADLVPLDRVEMPRGVLCVWACAGLRQASQPRTPQLRSPLAHLFRDCHSREAVASLLGFLHQGLDDGHVSCAYRGP